MTDLKRVPISDLTPHLQPFDTSGIGDGDGKIEYTDLSPRPLAEKLHYFAKHFSSSKPRMEETLAAFTPRASFRALPQSLKDEAENSVLLWHELMQLRTKIWAAQTFTPRLALTNDNGVETITSLGVDDSAFTKAFGDHPTQTLENLSAAEIQAALSSTWSGLRALYGDDVTQLFISERVGDAPLAILGDSLTAGMQFAAVSKASILPPMVKTLLQHIDVDSDAISQIGMEDAYPFDAQALLEGSSGMAHTVKELIFSILGSGTPTQTQPEQSIGILAGVPGATTHDIVADLSKESDWQSPGRIFLDKFRELYPKHSNANVPEGSFLQFVVGQLEQRLQHWQNGDPQRRGGAFAVGLGSNNLLGFEKIVLNIRDIDPAQFEADLRKLDEDSATLKDFGVRRTFFFPPDVRNMMIRIDSATMDKPIRYTDGSPVPTGSYTTLHWYRSAVERNARIPRKNIISARQYHALGERFQIMNRIAHRVLSYESNWLIIDNDRMQSTWEAGSTATPGVFSHFMNRAASEGITIDNVPGYGTMQFRGLDMMLSPDNLHPSPFAYLFWSNLLTQSLANHRAYLTTQKSCASPHSDTHPCYAVYEDLEHAAPEQLDAVMDELIARVAHEVRRNPTRWRPRRMNYPDLKDWNFSVHWARTASFAEQDKIIQDLENRWPLFNREALNAILAVVEPGAQPAPDTALHDIAGTIRQQLSDMDSEQRRKIAGPLLRVVENLTEQMQTDYWNQVGVAKAYLNGIGNRKPDVPLHLQEHGSTPGPMSPLTWKLYAGVDTIIPHDSPEDTRPILSLGANIEWGSNILPLSSAFPAFDFVQLLASGHTTLQFTQQEFAGIDIQVLFGARFYHDGIPWHATFDLGVAHNTSDPIDELRSYPGIFGARFVYQLDGNQLYDEKGGALALEYEHRYWDKKPGKAQYQPRDHRVILQYEHNY